MSTRKASYHPKNTKDYRGFWLALIILFPCGGLYFRGGTFVQGERKVSDFIFWGGVIIQYPSVLIFVMDGLYFPNTTGGGCLKVDMVF